MSPKAMKRTGSATAGPRPSAIRPARAAAKRRMRIIQPPHLSERCRRGYMTGMSDTTAPKPSAAWLKIAPAGLRCAPGGFHIDPVQPVERAVITHGHGDHARPGHAAVLATPETIAIMRARHGDAFPTRYQPLSYGEPIRI